MSSWADALAAIDDCIQARPTEYGSDVRKVMADLIAKLRRENRPIPVVTSGYWPTFIVEWPEAAPARSLEVFGDRIEIYFPAQGRMEVWEEPHRPGDGFSQQFTDSLPT